MIPVGSTAGVSPIPIDTTAVRQVFANAPTLPPGSDGPELVHLGDGWIPQGQAHVSGSPPQLLTTYNQDGAVRLSLQDAGGTDGELGFATLGAPAVPDDLHGWERVQFASAHPPPDKGGGIAVHGDNVYVADTQGVYRYSLSQLRDADGGAPVPALDFQPTDGDASYISIHGDHAYIGQFGARPGGIGADDYGTDPTLTRYAIGSDGRLVQDADPIPTPPWAQGVAVTEHGLLYTTSYGSDPDASPHALVFQPLADFGAFEPATMPIEILGHELGRAPRYHDVLELDYYAEELNIVGDEVWITYESNAGAYAGKYEDNLGAAPGNTHVQRIPLSALDLSGTGVTAGMLASAAARD